LVGSGWLCYLRACGGGKANNRGDREQIRLAQLNGTHSSRRIFPNNSTTPPATKSALRGSRAFETDHTPQAPAHDENATTSFIGS